MHCNYITADGKRLRLEVQPDRVRIVRMIHEPHGILLAKDQKVYYELDKEKITSEIVGPPTHPEHSKLVDKGISLDSYITEEDIRKGLPGIVDPFATEKFDILNDPDEVPQDEREELFSLVESLLEDRKFIDDLTDQIKRLNTIAELQGALHLSDDVSIVQYSLPEEKRFVIETKRDGDIITEINLEKWLPPHADKPHRLETVAYYFSPPLATVVAKNEGYHINLDNLEIYNKPSHVGFSMEEKIDTYRHADQRNPIGQAAREKLLAELTSLNADNLKI